MASSKACDMNTVQLVWRPLVAMEDRSQRTVIKRKVGLKSFERLFEHMISSCGMLLADTHAARVQYHEQRTLGEH